MAGKGASSKGGGSSRRVTTSTGQNAPASGQYRVVGGRKEVTLVKGSTVPPVDGKGAKLVQVDPTKNGSGQAG
jgi:hypothetical protein